MKTAIGSISLFQIVIVFLLLFAGIMCLTINHSKAFSVKDQIINIIETEGTIDQETIDKITAFINEAGYRIEGNCPNDDNNKYQAYARDGKEASTNNAAYCLKEINVADYYNDSLKELCKNNACITTSGDYPEIVYYEVIVFYQLDIPLLKDAINLKLEGSTKLLFG